MKLLAVVAVLGSGCYLRYPEIPPHGRIRTPPAGSTVELEEFTEESKLSCNSRDKGECAYSDKYTSKKRRARTTYNGSPVSHYDFRQLVDPTFDAKVQAIRDRKGVCRISLAPTVLSAAAIGVAIYFLNEKDENYQEKMMYSVGAAAALYALSYPLGGFACVKADKEWKALHMDHDWDESYVKVYSETRQYYENLKELASKFNANGGSVPTEPAVDGDELPDVD